MHVTPPKQAKGNSKQCESPGYIYAVQDRMVIMPQGNFCIFVLLTGPRQDWVHVK